MRRLRPYPVAALAGWTLFVWVSRVGLAWSDDSLTTGEKVLGTLPPVIFVALATVTAVLLLTWEVGARGPLFAKLVTGFVLFSSLYWGLRLPFILANDHPGGFKVVHTVLAVVTVALAVPAWLSVNDTTAEQPAQLSSSSAS